MVALAIRRSTILNLTPKQRRLLKVVADRLDLGDPADFTQPPNTRWLVWDDGRINLRDLAAIGTLSGRLAEAEAAVAEPEDGQSPRQALRDWIVTNWKLDPPPEDDPNPYQWVLNNNGAPAAVRAASAIPDNWTATE